MSDYRDPERLAADLDRSLPPDSGALPARPSNDAALDAAARLAASPRPALYDDVRARMKAKMLAELPVPPQTLAPNRTRVMRPLYRYMAAGGAAAAVLMIAVAGVFALMRSTLTEPTPTPASIANVTETVIVAETPTGAPTIDSANLTTESTEASETNSPTAAPSATGEPTQPPTEFPTATDAPTEAPTDAPASTVASSPTEPPPPPTVTAGVPVEPTATESALETAVVQSSATPVQVALLTIEGEVERVVGQLVTISGFDIALEEGHPLLDILQVRDRVRLSGEYVMGRGVLTIDVDEFELINEDEADNVVEIGPDGDAWRDTGTCDNPPPTWAVAPGWRARCEGGDRPGNSGNANSQVNPNPPDHAGRPDDPGNSGDNGGNGQGNGQGGGNGQGNGSGNGQGNGKP